jgi:predicted ATP-grasp superfamily ATP-dependent carboligase
MARSSNTLKSFCWYKHMPLTEVSQERSLCGLLEVVFLDNSIPVVVIAPGFHGHAIARSLGRLGVPVYGVHADPHSPAASSRYWRKNFIWNIEKAAPDDSVDWLLQLGHTLGSRPLLLPTDDHSCVFLDERAQLLQAAFRFPEQPPGLTRALSNKQSMYHLCQTHGIPAAETAFPRSREDVIAFCQSTTFPVMLKGIDTLALRERTGVKMVLAHDGETLLRLYDEMETPESPNIMLQEYLGGGSRTVWMFDGYFNEQSDCLFGLTANMVRQYPAYTGVTSLGVCLTNETVARQTMTFMKAIGYRGALDLGFKFDARTGLYKAIDANPRIGRTFRLLVDNSGMDVARALYLDLTGQPVPTGQAREGRQWVVENFDLVCSARYRRDEHLGLRGWLRSYQGVEEAFWFARDDPLPFLAMIWSSLVWAGKRVLGKLRPRQQSQAQPAPGVPTAQATRSPEPVLSGAAPAASQEKS